MEAEFVEAANAVAEWRRLPFFLCDHVNEYGAGRRRELTINADAVHVGLPEGTADMLNWTALLSRAQRVLNKATIHTHVCTWRA